MAILDSFCVRIRISLPLIERVGLVLILAISSAMIQSTYLHLAQPVKNRHFRLGPRVVGGGRPTGQLRTLLLYVHFIFLKFLNNGCY